MSDRQKIHSVSDPEAPLHPRAPTEPRGTSTSDHCDPSTPEKRKRSRCFRSVCYTLCFLLLLVVILAATVWILYLVFKPKIPVYSIDRLEVTGVTQNPNSSLSATFNVMITATNPNEKIGIYYEDGSEINVWVREYTEDATGLLIELQRQLLQTGNIPLWVRVNQPVRVKLGKLKLMEMRFLVSCAVAVDSSMILSNSCKIKLRL